MCGFAGVRYRVSVPVARAEAEARAMNGVLRHRGPDSEGSWVDSAGQVAFGFSRLAIQDLSPAANQPMHSESRRHTIVFNGEIYNADELRDWISRPVSSFRTHSDTEVLLACIEARGLQETLHRSNGMFAIALWDSLQQKLFLARDRCGKKPLHYRLLKDRLTFGSEIKALIAADEGVPAVNQEAVEAFFALSYVPAPLTILDGIRKVRPGHILEVNSDLTMREEPFWSVASLLQNRSRSAASYAEQVEQVDATFADAVKRRLISDVPVGVLLSGGVDSSLVAYVLGRKLGVKLRTFTIALEDSGLDESAQARAIADDIGVENIALPLTRADALSAVEDVLTRLDEPFGDYSSIPTYAVCKLARQSVTVLLTGDGGDEVFGGYTRYEWAVGKRGLAARAYATARRKSPVLSPRHTALEIYRRLMTLGTHGGSTRRESLEKWAGGVPGFDGATTLDYLRYLDFQLYLPDDILVKTDRMSMASSVELRSPFLDPRLVEFSWTLPDSSLLKGNTRKRITRDLFLRYVNPSCLQARKYGFAVPVGDWLAGPLREQVEEAVAAIKDADLPAHVRPSQWWAALRRGENKYAAPMWLVFAFARWRERWRKAQAWQASA